MKENRMKHVLESIARRNVPEEDIDLRPRIAAKLKRKTFLMTLRARPAAVLMIALLGMLLMVGVAYALGRSMGYIPGYGVVDENVQMRILSEPVSQTRDGITITFNEVFLTSDKLFLTITTENIPSNLFVPMSNLAATVTCKGDWIYQLPDGSQLSFVSGSGFGTSELLESDVDRVSTRGSSSTQLSVPVNVNEITEMTVRIPCVTSDLPTGALPENWEFHLQFVPAPSGMIEMTAFPVIELNPSSIATKAIETSEAKTSITVKPVVNPISITKVIDTGDSYILMGEFIPLAGSVSSNCCYIKLKDANGQMGFDEMPMDIDPGTPTANTLGASTWIRRFKKEGVALPITIQAGDQHWKSVSVPFEFDAGDNPQPGDEWQIKQQFNVDGVPITLEKIRVISPNILSSAGGYVFYFTYPSDNENSGLQDIVIDGYPPSINSGFSGGGSDSDITPQPGINFSVEFTSIPKGKLTINLMFNVLESEQIWTLLWQP